MPDLQERGVVHFLIPQLEILDGARLSDEIDTIDAGTIMKANERISTGRPRGLVAWAKDRPPNRSTRARNVYPSRRRTVDDEDMAGEEALPKDSGSLHWDSPLTQGGGMVFSGNPRYQTNLVFRWEDESPLQEHLTDPTGQNSHRFSSISPWPGDH